jgi:hypothetical protein
VLHELTLFNYYTKFKLKEHRMRNCSKLFSVVRHLMPRTILSIFILFVFGSSYSQEKLSLATKVEIKNVSSVVVIDKLCFGKVVLDKAPLQSVPFQRLKRFKEIDSILVAEDSIAIEQQTAQIRNLNWDTSLINNAVFIGKADIKRAFKESTRDAWKSFYDKYGGGYYQMSIPLFTKDGAYCIINFWQTCGVLIGEGQIFILKREASRWVLYRKIGTWIS